MRPVGRVPSNFGDNGDHVYSVPSNFSAVVANVDEPRRLSGCVGPC